VKAQPRDVYVLYRIIFRVSNRIVKTTHSMVLVKRFHEFGFAPDSKNNRDLDGKWCGLYRECAACVSMCPLLLQSEHNGGGMVILKGGDSRLRNVTDFGGTAEKIPDLGKTLGVRQQALEMTWWNDATLV
jgi:hypothetical protein